MKKRLWKFMAPLLMVLGIVTLAGCGNSVAKRDTLSNASETNTIIWGVKADTNLFGLMNIKTGRIQGFDVDIAKALTKEILGPTGRARFVQVTSDTRMPLLKAGNIDAIIATMTITPERKKQADFSDVYFRAGGSILVKKGSKIKSVKDLKKGTKTIVVQGSTYGDSIKKAAPDTQLLQLSDYASAFTALKAGQADALSTDNGILYGMSLQDKGYVVVGGTYTNEPYGIAVNKGQDAFRRSINKALAKIKENGTYDKIANKWFGDVPGFHVKEVK